MFKTLGLVIAVFFAGTCALAAEQPFWVWDLTVMPPGFRQPEFDLARSVQLAHSKDALNLWVERDLGEHAPNDETLTKVIDTLSRRVVDFELEAFGEQPTPPSKNRNIELLVAAIPPYEKHGKKFGFDGFFNVFDQLTEAQAREQQQHSNERNVIYVNALQNIGSDYMLGEAAMQLTGFYTDTKHVEAYRAHPEWPLAVDGYGISYGGLSLLAEYLITHFDAKWMGKLAPATGNGFARLENVYGRSWNELFAGYLQWLYEQNPKSNFPGSAIAPRNPLPVMKVAATGVLFLPERFEAGKLAITAAPKACTGSRNVIRTKLFTRDENDKNKRAQALWIESTPPCATTRGEGGFETDAFTLEAR